MAQLQTSAADMLAQPPGFGLISGPGTGTSDSIPAALSDGEVVIPAEDVRAFGAAQIMSMIKKGGKGLPKPKVLEGRVHAAVGGLIEDPGAVTRVGNSYSGGNVTGPITVNGGQPGGTFSAIGGGPVSAASRLSQVPAVARPGTSVAPAAPWNPASGLGRPNALGSLADTNAQIASLRASYMPTPGASAAAPAAALSASSALTTPSARPAPFTFGAIGGLTQTAQAPATAPAPANPPAAALPSAPAKYADRNDAFNAGANARSAMARQPRLGYAEGGLVREDDLRRLTQAQAQNAAGDVIGRRPTLHMGPVDLVQPQQLARPAGAVAASQALPAPGARSALATLPALPGASAAPVSSAASALGRIARVGVPLVGGLVEGKQVYDVATDPSSTGIDVAAQAARGAGRLGAAGAGAAGGAALGAFGGPPGALVGGLVGGAAGYLGADKAIAAGRALTGGPAEAPAPAVAGGDSPGGAAFGVFPQMPKGGTDAGARPVPTQAQVRAVDNNAANSEATSAGPSLSATPPAPAQSFQAGGTVSELGGVGSAGRILQMQRDAQHLQDLSAIQQRIDANNGPTPGLAVMDGAAADAERRSQFNEQANLNNARTRGTWSPRRGYQGDDAAVEAALRPMQLRAQAATAARQADAETKKAVIAERGSEARARMIDANQKEANAIDRAKLGIDAIRAGNTGVPTGYRVKTDGTGLEPVPGGPADPNTPKGKNALNDTQAKALQFGSRMQASEDILTRMAAGGVNQPGLLKRGADAVGLGAAANWTQSPEQQQVEQAQRDFINAALRRESGAAIAESEFSNARQQYFPQPGDSPQVIAQKLRNRELATRGILAEVPDSEKRLAQVSAPSTAATPSAPAAPASGLPPGMTKQVGTSGGKPVYEDPQGRRFIGA